MNKIFKFLPKAAPGGLAFQNHPFSPGRDHNTARLKNHGNKGFSGPMIPMIPSEARRKSKNGSFETQEPTSPKISCMGQIKHKKNKKKINKTKNFSLPKYMKPQTKSSPKEVKKQASSFLKKFSDEKSARRKSDASADHHKPAVCDRVPNLGQMRRFASGRDTFANFDWTVSAPVTPEEFDQPSYDWDDDREESDQEEEEVMIPFSAPILLGGGEVPLQPRKEINLWKRRTMVPPRPLELRHG
ncbi:Syringolide-induced protein 14-1-1 [Quillaja saponaria]|uniref:Syringolide-induced protein 14-1-1 n=1 Tax=Quillaja saponaria TaxID=32244 RepID=A0AAD7LHF9_QUISA|nr:Syringolide-induced protein 14-1-1 [Quillaja saponaria]